MSSWSQISQYRGGLPMTWSPWSVFLAFVHITSPAIFQFHFTFSYFLHWFSQSFPFMSHCSGKPHIPLCLFVSSVFEAVVFPMSSPPLQIQEELFMFQSVQCFIYFKTEWQLPSFLCMKPEIGSPTHI